MTRSPSIPKLVHALHEGRLDPAGLAELERRVLADPAAMRAYLDLTAVHGHLLHDAGRLPALDDEPVPRPTLAVSRAQRRSQFLRAATLAASIALLAGVAFLFRPAPEPPPGPVVVESDDPPPIPVEPDPAPRPLPTPELFAEADPAPLTAPRPKVRETSAPADRAETIAFVDAELRRAWDDADLSPSPEAAPGEWLRRVWLDLAGHIPPAEDVERFLADDRADRRDREINRLLGSPDFAAHLAERWTTALVGRAPRDGVDRAGLRAYLAAAFGAGRGWDDTAGELVAATGSVRDAPAANFFVAHVNNAAVPATAVTARVLLGTQIQCMQCHDHPTNAGAEWEQERFWQLNAFFKGTDVTRAGGVAALESRAADGPTFFETRRGVVRAAYPGFRGATFEDEPDRRRKLAELLLADDRRLVARSFVNRAWDHLFGAGLVNPVDDLGPHNPPVLPAVLDRLTDRFVAAGYDVRDLYRVLAGVRAYDLSSAATAGNAADDPAKGEAPLFTRVYPKPLTAEQTFDSLAVARGAAPDPAARDGWVAGFVRRLANDENGERLPASTDIPRALALMNGEALNGDMGDGDAAIGDAPGDLDGLFLSTLSRRPTARERATLDRFVRRPGGLEDLRWALLNSGEFATVP